MEVNKLRRRRPFAAVLALALTAVLLFSLTANAAVFTFETQFEYDKAELGWLTDLIIKEDMSSVPGAVSTNSLSAVPSYPYTETSQSFSEDVEKYLTLYTLKEGSFKASYVFLFDLLGSNANVFASQVSDSAARDYLENIGITYPADPDNDMKAMAKALYAGLITGAYDGLTGEELSGGISLEKALIRYVSSLTGLKKSDVDRFAPAKTNGLYDYLLASSRYTLWANGYDVNAATPEDRVTELMAVMTVKSIGVKVDENLSFNELRSVYTAALLGKKFNVTVDPVKLAAHIEKGTVPFYILQLLGRRYGLSLREDDVSLNEAFNLVAKNSDLFSVEADEFYADIYEYTFTLSSPRSSVWVYPTSYAGTDDAAFVMITVNGKEAQDNAFTRIGIDPEKTEQKLTVRVEAVRYNERDVKTYTITLKTGADAPASPAETPDVPSYESADSIVAQIMRSVGVNEGVVKATDRLIEGLPGGLHDAMNFIAPTFGGETEKTEEGSLEEIPAAPFDASSFLRILDSLGAGDNAAITGVEGVNLLKNAVKNGQLQLISFDR